MITQNALNTLINQLGGFICYETCITYFYKFVSLRTSLNTMATDVTVSSAQDTKGRRFKASTACYVRENCA